jgi:hypothetical protein
MINESKNISVKIAIFVSLKKIRKMIKLDELDFLIIG